MQKCVWQTNGIQLPNQGSCTQQNSGMSLVFICLVVWKKQLEILRDVYKKRTKNVISPDWASRQIEIKYPDWSNSPPWTGPAAKKFQIPHLLFHSKISIHVVFKELLICWCFLGASVPASRYHTSPAQRERNARIVTKRRSPRSSLWARASSKYLGYFEKHVGSM